MNREHDRANAEQIAWLRAALTSPASPDLGPDAEPEPPLQGPVSISADPPTDALG
ncbi:hypothetical protein [Deinococcus multiflagellatus]|nr:hypothetical protein [Deinococcus multiflagellatus]MBZ9715029.1 hypothetical protein [Deinococcus multiflagellatus]